MSIYRQIGEKIVYLRKKKSLTQEELALRCGISPSYLRCIEHGTANPTLKELSRIAEGLETDVNDLLGISLVLEAVL